MKGLFIHRSATAVCVSVGVLMVVLFCRNQSIPSYMISWNKQGFAPAVLLLKLLPDAFTDALKAPLYDAGKAR